MDTADARVDRLVGIHGAAPHSFCGDVYELAETSKQKNFLRNGIVP
jgi:hypothetical protein